MTLQSKHDSVFWPEAGWRVQHANLSQPKNIYLQAKDKLGNSVRDDPYIQSFMSFAEFRHLMEKGYDRPLMLHIGNISTAKEAQSLMLRSCWLCQERGKVQMLPFNSVILSIHLNFVRTMVGSSFSLLHHDFFYCFYTVLFWIPWGKILPEEPLKYSWGLPPTTVFLGSHGKASFIPWPDPSLLLAWLHIIITATRYGLSHCITYFTIQDFLNAVQLDKIALWCNWGTE